MRANLVARSSFGLHFDQPKSANLRLIDDVGVKCASAGRWLLASPYFDPPLVGGMARNRIGNRRNEDLFRYEREISLFDQTVLQLIIVSTVEVQLFEVFLQKMSFKGFSHPSNCCSQGIREPFQEVSK